MKFTTTGLGLTLKLTFLGSTLLCSSLLCSSLLCPPAARADADRSEFKGYIPTNEQIRVRMMKEESNFQLGTYLDENFNRTDNLLILLGAYTGGGFPAKFHNGRPNGVNTLLWTIAFGGFAKDLAGLCTPVSTETGSTAKEAALQPLRTDIDPRFIEVLQPLCAWPKAQAKTDEVLYSFWTAIEGFDAPYEEFEAWKSFFTTSEYSNTSASETITAMALAMWMNPFFLLR